MNDKLKRFMLENNQAFVYHGTNQVANKPYFRKVMLPSNVPGKLLLHHTPTRYGEKWETFVENAKKENLTAIARLTSSGETLRNAPVYMDAINTGKTPFVDLSYCPIPDFSVPADKTQFVKLVQDIASRLINGETVLIHCGAGIGRTGTVAVCVLIKLGLDKAHAYNAVKWASAGPETVEQRALVDWFEQNQD